MGRVAKGARWIGYVIGGIGLLLGVLFLVLTRSGVGQAFAVERALRVVEGGLRANISVQSVGSAAGLHRGAVLRGVEVQALDGSTVLTADSLGLDYEVRGLLAGRIVLRDLQLWGPVVRIANQRPEDPFAIQTIIPPPSDSATGGPERVVLEGLTIHDGRVEFRQRLEEGVDPGMVRAERILGEEGWVRTVDLEAVNAHLRRVGIITPGEEGVQVDIGGFAARVLAVEDPVEINNLVGNLGYEDARVTLGIERVALPLGSRASGILAVDFEGESPVVDLSLVATPFLSGDVEWLLPDLPRGRGAVEVGLHWDDRDLRVSLAGGRLDFGDGAVSGHAIFTWANRAEVATLSETEIELESLDMSIVEVLAGREIPVRGALAGRLSIDGTLLTPRVDGRLTHLSSDYPSSVADLNGRFLLGEDPGFENVNLNVRRLSLGLVDVFADAGLDPSRVIQGTATLHGRLSEALGLDVDVTYPAPSGGPASRFVVRGTVRQSGDELAFDLGGRAEPVYFDGLVTDDSPLRALGRAEGSLSLTGTTTDLTFTTDLQTVQGRLSLEASFDATDPWAGYDISAEASDFEVTGLLPNVPEGTVLTGSLELLGSGGSLETADLTTSARLVTSTIAHLQVDSLDLSGTVRGGIIQIDTLRGSVGQARVQGGGTLGTTGQREGRLDLRVETQDLAGLRPYFLGPDVIAQDTLSPLSRQILELDGIDADTLPLLEDVRLAGSLFANVTLAGALDSLSVTGQFDLADAVYGGNFVDRAHVDFSAEGLPSVRPRIDALIETGNIRILDRAFDSASVRLDYQEPRGRTDVFLARSPTEDYRAHVAFDWSDSLRVLNLDEMTLRFDEDRWNLGGPATIRWDPTGLTFDNLRLIRPGMEGFRLVAQGRFPFRGGADLDVAIERLDLDRVAHLLQLSDTLTGVVDAELHMTGTARNPEIEGSFAATDLRWTDFRADRVETEFTYRDLQLDQTSQIWQSGLQILSVTGTIPVDLGVHSVEARFPDEAVDLSVTIDSLPLSLLMAPFPTYSNVQGTLSGSVDFGGTLDGLAPNGELRLENGSAYLEAVGVQHRELQATIRLNPDGRVGVTGSLRAQGTAELDGTVTLDPASDPILDLGITLTDFQALQRQDVTARLSGSVSIGGSYRRPVMTGDLSVREGTLYIEEFIRSASVLDLASLVSDSEASILGPDFLDTPGIIQGQNPFLRNILMRDLTLRFTNNAWVESQEMRVEMGGELDVLYDRAEQEISLLGTLNALRGNYRAFSRGFNVQDGTLRFFGTPGINPELDIRATTRVRGQDRSTITVTANVTGTLISPRVDLTSDQAGLGQEDLISYMLFGRPAYGLTASQSQALGAAGNLLVGSGLTLGLQGFNAALGSAASDLGLAYLSVTQQDLGALGGNSLGNTLGSTVLETGAYLSDDVFLTLLLRPLYDGNTFGGLRLEWAASSNYTLEAAIEERFFRSRVIGFGELGIEDQLGFGLFIFREWGY